jgi:UDP-glucose 4-epimerase
MTILVTGGCGFIGGHLVRWLREQGQAVRVLDDLSTGRRDVLPDDVSFIEGDIVEPSVSEAALDGVDAVFHLAAIASVERSRNDWYRAHQVNSGGMVNLLHSIARSGRTIPVVFASSAAIYGDCATLPIHETAPPSPLSAYGADKLANEYHAKVATALHGIPTAGMRFFNVYGPGQDPSSPYSGVVSIFMEKARAGEALTLLGDGLQSRDFVYVRDVVAGLWQAMQALQAGRFSHEIFNIGTGAVVTVRQLAEEICSIAGTGSAIRHGPARAGEVRHSQSDISKAQRMLGYAPTHRLAEGLAHTFHAPEG